MASKDSNASLPSYGFIIFVFLATNLIYIYLGFSWQSHHDLHAIPLLGRLGSASPSKFDDSDVQNLLSRLNHTEIELQQTRYKLSQLHEALKTTKELSHSLTPNITLSFTNTIGLRDAQTLSQELHQYIGEKKLPLGWNPIFGRSTMVSPIGHACESVVQDLIKFMDYEVGGPCPDDQNLAQSLMLHGCEPLPRRRCFAKTPASYNEASYKEPYPLPQSMWTVPKDESISWTPYTCKSFKCLNDRKNKGVSADCLDCFELNGRERWRWVRRSSRETDLDYSVEEVLEMKNGTIRIGLDIGGGTATFAVRMMEHNVTIITTSLNLDGPFNNFIALRGVVPLHLNLAQRLPFFDNTLDIIHSMHVLSNWIPTTTFEFILFDIDRVLRPGGIFWLDHFFCLEPQLEKSYLPLFNKLGYKKLKWAVGRKLDRGANLREVYLSAVLEKPLSR